MLTIETIGAVLSVAPIVALYFAQYPPTRKQEFKIGFTKCAQRRAWDSCFVTTAYEPWTFIWFIPCDQSRDMKKIETILHEYASQSYDRTTEMPNGEMFRVRKGKKLNPLRITKDIAKFLGSSFFVYSEPMLKEYKTFLKFDPQYEINTPQFPTYDGPFYVPCYKDGYEKFKCCVCMQERPRKCYYLIKDNDDELRVGHDCLEKLRELGYKHVNEMIEFFHGTEEGCQDEVLTPTDDSFGSLLECSLEYMSRGKINLTAYSCDTENDTVKRALFKSAILCLHYFHARGDETMTVSIENIISHYTEHKITITKGMIIDMALESGNEIFELQKNNTLRCSFLLTLLKVRIPEQIKVLEDNMRTRSFVINKDVINEVVNSPQHKYNNKLDKNQRDVIQKILQNNISILLGQGGTGKGEIIKRIFTVCEKEEIIIHVTSTGSLVTWDNSKKCLVDDTRGKHISLAEDAKDSYRFENISLITCKPPVDHPVVLIIDEGMFVGPINLHQLIKKYKKGLLRLIIVGDLNQSQAINFPWWWNWFIPESKIKIFTLYTNHRTDDPILVKFRDHFCQYSYSNKVLPLERRIVNITQSLIREQIKVSSDVLKICDTDGKEYEDCIGRIISKPLEAKLQFIGSTHEECNKINNDIYHSLENGLHSDEKCDECWTDIKGRTYCMKCIGQFRFILTKNIKLNSDMDDARKFGLLNGRMFEIGIESSDKQKLRVKEKHGKSLDIQLSDQVNRELFDNILINADLSYCLTPEKYQGKEDNLICIMWSSRFNDPNKFYSAITRPREQLIIFMNPSDTHNESSVLSGSGDIGKRSTISISRIGPTINGSQKITAGEYRGKTFLWVYENAEEYIDWLDQENEERGIKSPNLQDLLLYAKHRDEEKHAMIRK
jgi:AAA domain